jgi:tetratricopeptide (TPR) repeat protein
MYPPPGRGQIGPATPLARLARLGDRRVGAALRLQLRARRTWIWAALLALLGGILCAVPLFNVLGYEFSFAMAIASSVAAADLGAALSRRLAAIANQDPGDAGEADLLPGARTVFSLAAAAGLLAVALLLPPLLLVSLNALRVRNCDWSFGFACYSWMTVLSALWAASVGALCGLGAGGRRVLSNALPHLVLVASVVHSVWRFYDAPPVFSYNPLCGFWSGNLYDENIQLGEPLVWSRAHQLLAVAALLALAAALIDAPSARLRLWRRRPTRIRFELALCLMALVAAVAIRARAGELGFSLGTDEIADELPGRKETAHFIIHYPPGGDIGRDIDLIAEDHEFRLAQLTRSLGVRPPPHKIASFYFESADQKQALMGARNVYMAKPWREEIYLHDAPFPHAVVRHEIAHVVAGGFGDRVFHVSARPVLGLPVFFNVGLIEGIAVAADWPDHFNRALTPHQSVRAMMEMGMAPPVDRLLSTGFFAFSSARSYTLAGSFVRFLLDRYGAERLRTLYRTGGDFSAAYRRPQRELVAEWQAMIARVELAPGDAEVVRERFRKGGIFQRPCPHAIADKQNRAGELAARGDMDGAIRLIRQVCSDAPGEPSHELDLADLYERAGRAAEAAAIFRRLAAATGESITSSTRVEALLGLARLAARAGDWAQVIEHVDRAGKLPVDDDLLRQARAQRMAAGHAGPAGPALRAYFWPPGDPNAPLDPMAQLGRAAAAVAAEPGLGMGHYLVGRNLSGRGAPAEAAEALARALALGLPDPLLTRECAEHLAASAYMAGDLATVERAAAILTAEDQPTVTRLYGYDWLERVVWKRTGRLPRAPLGPPATPR